MQIFNFLRHLRDLRKAYKHTDTYVVLYTSRPGTYLLRALVEANSSYEAARLFDTDPSNSENARYGAPYRA